MTEWLAKQIHTGYKKPLPILSFPCVSVLGITVRELISDSSLQARGMRLVAERTDAAACRIVSTICFTIASVIVGKWCARTW